MMIENQGDASEISRSVNYSIPNAARALAVHLTGDPKLSCVLQEHLTGIANAYPFRTELTGRAVWVVHFRSRTEATIARTMPAPSALQDAPETIESTLCAFNDARRESLATEFDVGDLDRIEHLDDAFYVAHGTLASALILTSWKKKTLQGLVVGYGRGAVDLRFAREIVTLPRPPLVGAYRLIAAGYSLLENHHAYHRTQRFAVDAELVDADQDKRVIAPISGTVVSLRDDRSEGIPFDSTDELGSVYGNHVVINVGDCELILCHLAEGSIRVSSGAWLKPGDLIGMVGNTGQSLSAHLHIHAQERSPARHGVPITWPRLHP